MKAGEAKSIALFLLKLAIAGGLIYWIVQNGQLDLSLFGQFFRERLGDWIITLFLVAIAFFLVSYRWKCILDLKAKTKLPYGQVAKALWISIFFNPVLPGAISGDIVRLAYGRNLDRNLSIDYLISSIAIDRILGLSALAMISGLSSLALGNQWVEFDPKIKKLILFNISLFLILIFFFFVFLSSKRIKEFVGGKFEMIPWVGSWVSKIFAQFCFIGQRRKTLLFCLFLSTMIQSIEVFIFWFLSSPDLASRPPFLELATLFPTGILAISLPITPLGLGVGHLVFNKLFALYGLQGGANYFNSFVLTHMVVGFLGGLPYLFGKKRVSFDQLASIEREVKARREQKKSQEPGSDPSSQSEGPSI